MRHYRLQEESKEIQKFSTMIKQNLPNSKRTLIPSYQPLNSKENIHHKATSYYSYKFNTNSVGSDLLPNEEQKPLTKRKSAGRILQESNPPLNIRQLKPNKLHQKYIESSQINNIPGPDITKRLEDKKINFIENNNNNNNKKLYKYYTKNYYNNNNNQDIKKKIYALRNNDTESFQRKIFRDYNSNIACLPGVTINEKEKARTLVATNSKKNESHISLGYDNDENINSNNLKNKYDYFKKPSQFSIPKTKSFSGKKIIRDRNKESNNTYSRIIDSKINRTGYLYMDERRELDDNYKENLMRQNKYTTDKNKSQIIFG